jgi:3-isopropylmalate dehydrogenase
MDIPLLAGDGVGPELAAAARTCIDALNGVANAGLTLVDYPIGYRAYCETGDALPEATIAAIRRAPATLLAAISTTRCPPPSPMGQLRRQLGLFADVRHCVSSAGSLRSDVDVVMFRECSEGFLADRNMHLGAGEFMPTPDVALSVRVVTRDKSERIARLALQHAREHGRRKITIAHKQVVFALGCGLFLECVREQAGAFPCIVIEQELVDSLAANLVVQPERYDMILSTNLFGDILADVAAAQVGATTVPIVNANDDIALFCPTHDAFDAIAGHRLINPLPMLRTVLAMLQWLSLADAAHALERVLADRDHAALQQSWILPDGKNTEDVTQEVVRSLSGAS